MTSHLTTRPRLSPELDCQQHAMALDTYYSYDCCVLPPLDSWDWDWNELHTLGAAGAGAGSAAVHQEPNCFFPATPGVESPGSSEASSGYLQDAVAHWSGRCSNKRQRMVATTPSPPPRPATVVSEDLHCLVESFWDSSADGGDDDAGNLRHDLNATIPEEAEIRCSFVSGEDDGAGASWQRPRGPSAPAAPCGGEEEEAGAGADAAAPSPPRPRFLAAPLQQQLQKATAVADHAAAARRDDRPGEASTATEATASVCPSLLEGEEKRGVGVLYPFAVVKPLGLDDSRMTTLSDVNQRILKRPARPVRHPVGPFACPAVTVRGLGLSGKAVVSLTKIRTGGNGTITIIRTRG
nr:unnamed protein product [Digitaria exilis]